MPTQPPANSRLVTARQAAADAVESLDGALDDLLATVKPRLRGVLHQGAFYVSIVCGLALLVFVDGARTRLAVGIYALSVSLLFGTSALYHRRNWGPRGTAVMRRLDHSMIFVLIAGTYTPFALLVLEGTTANVVLALVWGGALLGIALKVAWIGANRWLAVPLYVALGWAAVFVLPALLRGGGVAVLVLVIIGGVLYSAGALVYATRRPDPAPRVFGYHEVFHALTLAAFLLHYVAVSLAAYSLPA